MNISVLNSDAGGEHLAVERFIARWQGLEGGQERANYAPFLIGLCESLQLPHPDPAEATHENNDYVFERAVQEISREGVTSFKRIDLYKRDCFVLEAKQSRQAGQLKQLPGFVEKPEPAIRGRRTADRAWDILMRNARTQAENYVRLLPQNHEPPPFVIVCDVGHCFEIYSNFRRDGKAYDQFPDRQSFRIYLEDLRDPDIRQRLRHIWIDPGSLDPARHAARVTREIAERLAAISKSLEKNAHKPEEVAAFLSRCLFTMFAESVGLLPEHSFMQVLQRCEAEPATFIEDVGQLWQVMDTGGYAHAIRKTVPRFNGEFFKQRTVLPLAREEIGELAQAASRSWRDVDPSIFGTLLEQALDPLERRKLGSHFTPRAYVERLVIATVIEPLRQDWAYVLSTIDLQKSERRDEAAIETARKFHDKLCAVRILDPACGTGNFLYVSLELLKRLEGEVLEVLTDLGGQEALSGLEGHSVDPHQFLGMELNPRAAAIAELVLWIGHLQWHVRTRGGMPSEPILRAFRNIVVRDAVLKVDAGYGNPRTPDWPAAEFIVGNPPFIGGKDIRARMGDGYAEALWRAHRDMNDGADFVMYWWGRAADLLVRKGTVLRRFGFVTTNSISQVFQRRVIERHLNAKKPVSLVMAIPDHPWTKVTPDAAAVRIAMTVAEAGRHDGVLREVTRETGVDTDTPVIEFDERIGRINSDLTMGVDVAGCVGLKSTEGLSSRGVSLHGDGFIITPAQAAFLGLGKRAGLERHIRLYRNGRDLTSRPRDVMVIDLFGLGADEVRERFPEVYQHLLQTVKQQRIAQHAKSPTKDAEAYASLWWLFGKPRQQLRPALKGLTRYIATVETAKHRIFQFLDASILPDNKLVNIATEDAFALGVLSSPIHFHWYIANSAKIGVYEGNAVYVKSRCFDPFPFPDASDEHAGIVRKLAEDIDAHRKRVLAAHSHLTLTGLYNVLEMLRSGIQPGDLQPGDRAIFDDGLVLILKEFHDRLDDAVADAYGWPRGLGDQDILARLVALNRERACEETRGKIRWLRPDYQIPRLGSPTEKAELDLIGGSIGEGDIPDTAAKPSYPTDDLGQNIAVSTILAAALTPLDAPTIAAAFKQGRKITPKVTAVLAALSRMGYLDTVDDGRSFALRRAV